MSPVVQAGVAAALRATDPRDPAMTRALVQSMQRGLALIQAALVGPTGTLTARRGPGSDLFRGGGQGGLAVDTGRTRASVSSQVLVAGGQIVGVVGSDAPWMGIHELGGTITGNPLLAIPTKFAKQFPFLVRGEAGGARGRRSGFALMTVPRSARTAARATVYRTFIRRSRGGALFVFARAGERLIPLILLAERVTMPARRPFGRALDATSQAVGQLFNESVLRTLVVGHAPA